MIVLIAGTNNINKFKEFEEILNSHSDLKVALLQPVDVLNQIIEIEETEDTLEGNALLKAKTIYDLTKVPSFSDDTGLEIDALSGQPGVHSARFSGIQGNDKANREKVLKLMDGIPEHQRKARFRTVICLVGDTTVDYFIGTCEGRITESEKGDNGFGYDSIFIPEGHNLTFAEMTPEMKNSISHRKKAIIQLAEYISKNSKLLE